MIITGPGADLLTIVAYDPTPNSIPSDGNGLDDGDGNRILRINGGLTVAISGMTLTGADAPAGGGAIRSEGSVLELDGLKIVGNNARGDTNFGPAGGGLYIRGTYDGPVTITNTLVADNYGGRRFPSSSGGLGGGAFIYLNGIDVVTISNSQFINNTAGARGGGLYILNGQGSGPGEFTLKDSVISENLAGFKFAGTSGNHPGGDGGGMFVSTFNPSFGDVNGFTILQGNTVSHNIALRSGGGLFLDSDSATLCL